MLIFKDVISGDEVASDSFPHKLVDDLYYEVDGKTISVKEGIDDSLIGGNASAEGEDADDGAADGVKSVINVVYSHQLVETSFDKKSYTAYIKGYMKAIKAHLEKNQPERVDVFTKGMPEIVKKILGNFDNYQFFTGASMNVDGLVVLLNYREDGVTPYFIIFKDGVIPEKV
ncbi:translationally-controlled tumor protein [Capsaspora owczarzaki ATCC 30864]|uniref:Translationally-controlled tumor protein n=1 Tax=Capsaspora owczarzaki (strain ATCC 30864) TaxID=595528 RepID=A0A0D2X0X0_CAPO3|nr:translationally-controlled tumor protein [Capsaspora owczarzaki ATCC 30864]KJE89794.1 translationally-controlled tumor protein [Capsaspora owczarzaki ATCC 30864]|eukprot:XP_004349715.1 translationally-controlled tumor protein [Capsaspora owczarzaki ATCC 30864]